MPFDTQLVEASLALDLIGTTDLPRLAQDALEAGFDGPSTRRLAAFDLPTFFQVRDVLPRAMHEWGIVPISPKDAYIRLARHRVAKILASEDDPLKHTRDFETIWIRAGYPRELGDLGALAEEVFVARYQGASDDQIRVWLLDRLRACATS